MFAKSLSNWAEVHFDSSVRFTGAAAGSQLPSVWVDDSQNIRFFGGDVTGAGNDICFDYNTNVLWWDFNVHDTAMTCVLMRGINRDTSGMDLRGTLSRCGYDLSLDPRRGEGHRPPRLQRRNRHWPPRQGQPLRPLGARSALRCGRPGAGCSELEAVPRCATDHVPGATTDRRKRCAVLGADTRNFDVPYLYGDTLAGKAVETDGGLDSSNSNISVDYARASNVRLSPTYQPDSKITYGDVG